MQRIPLGPLWLVIQFCPLESRSISRGIESARLGYLLNLLKKLERENLDVFPYLEGLTLEPIRGIDNTSAINLLFKKLIADAAVLTSILSAKKHSIHHIFHLIISKDTSRIFKRPKEIVDHSIAMISNSLREQPHNLNVPTGTIEEIKAWFVENNHQEELNQIVSLDLSSKKLNYVPGEIAKCVNLKHLILNDNDLYNLSDAICDLEMLETLNLSNNHLSTLPDSIFNLIKLRELNLSNNPIKISELFKVFSHLTVNSLTYRLHSSISKIFQIFRV